jgi:hypothetical protein
LRDDLLRKAKEAARKEIATYEENVRNRHNTKVTEVK